MKITNRRQFLGSVGKGMGFAAVGFALADRLGFAEALALSTEERLRFGALDPLVDLMQETPPDALLPLLVERLRSGTSLSDLVAAAALANARAFGGTNYNAYHALMAMMPSYEMAAQMPEPYRALPVLKVVHRNARFVQESGRSIEDAIAPLDGADGEHDLVASARARDLAGAELGLSRVLSQSRAQAYEELQAVVRDEMNVHRVVLSWRAYDLLKLTGEPHAFTLFRQCVRFCIDEDESRVRNGRAESGIRELLPDLMDQHGLDARDAGNRVADNQWIERMSDTIFSSDCATAASAVAAALAEGFTPEDVGAAMSLAATRLLLHDPGRSDESPGKPVGSVHGASVGVHASESANAWRNIARVGSARDAFASLIAGAYHTAGQSRHVGSEPFDHDGERCTASEPAELLGAIESAVRARDQRGACLAARRYCELAHAPDTLFAHLLPFAVSQDGALHAEKYFRTVQEEYETARPAHRALHLVALTRVQASSFGFPAPGDEEARKLLAT